MTILPSEASGPPWAVRWTQGPVYGLQALDTEGLDRLRGPQLNLPEGQGWWRLPDPQPSQRPRVRADIGKATAVVPPSPDLTGQINGIDIPRIDAAFLYPMGTEAPWLRAEWMGLLNLSCGVEAVELGLLAFRGREPTPFCPLWRGALPHGYIPLEPPHIRADIGTPMVLGAQPRHHLFLVARILYDAAFDIGGPGSLTGDPR